MSIRKEDLEVGKRYRYTSKVTKHERYYEFLVMEKKTTPLGSYAGYGVHLERIVGFDAQTKARIAKQPLRTLHFVKDPSEYTITQVGDPLRVEIC